MRKEEAEFFKKFFEQLLQKAGLSRYYRCECRVSSPRDGRTWSHAQFFIRESTSAPPNAEAKSKFEALIKTLEMKESISTRKVKASTSSIGDISLLSIEPSDPSKPYKILNSYDMPPAIYERWSRFSKDMQDYLLLCFEEFAVEEKLNRENPKNSLLAGFANVATEKLGDTFRSPVSLSIPKIPVRLPNQALADGRSKDCYDLMDILDIEQRDPNNPAKRRDPTTRNYFGLNEVIPDKKAFDELKQRRAAIVEQERGEIKVNDEPTYPNSDIGEFKNRY